MTMHPVPTADPADAAALLQGEAPRLIFKHSPTCGISVMAHAEVSRFADAHPEVPVLLVDVLGQRALSRQIGVELQVAHASPQVLLVANGASRWNASHRRVTMEAIERAVSALPPANP